MVGEIRLINEVYQPDINKTLIPIFKEEVSYDNLVQFDQTNRMKTLIPIFKEGVSYDNLVQFDQTNRITAVIPAYNEAVTIGSIVLQAKQYVDSVIVIDDGSYDKTSTVAEMAGAEVIRHSQNMGKGAALKTGFEAAIQKNSEIIVTIDADGQHDPSEIPKLIEPLLLNETDIVNGSRYIGGKTNNTPIYRRIGQTLLDNVTNFNSKLNITDTQSGFRAFSVNAVPAFRFKSNGMGIESEMLADAAKAKLRIKEIEIGVRYDVDCSKENPISHGLNVLITVLNDMELNRPLYYFTVPGMFLIASGATMGMGFLRDYYYGENIMFGPALLMILVTLVGIFMAFTGIILHTMSKMINEA